MSELQELLGTALLNNTYDYDVMHSTLSESWHNSYSYLYRIQQHKIEYEELHYKSDDVSSRNIHKIGHLYLDNSWRACFDAECDTIHICDREEYRRSPFYHKKLTVSDMVENYKIFKKIPIVLLDNHVIWDYTVKIFHKDGLAFTLPYFRQLVLKNERSDTGDIIYEEHDVQVLLVDNLFYQRKEFSLSDLQYVRDNEIQFSIDNSEKKKIKDKTGLFFCSFYFPSGKRSYGETSTLLYMKSEGDNFVVTIPENIQEILKTWTEPFFVSFIFINELHHYSEEELVIDETEKALFLLQKEEMIPFNMPIPVENLMVWKKQIEEDNFRLVKNTDMVKLHYPNIYELNSEKIKEFDAYDIFFFYHEMEDYKYTPIHEFYYRFLVNRFKEPIELVLNKIWKDKYDMSEYQEEQIQEFKEVFTKILNYKYYNHKYGEIDFVQRYLPIKNNDNENFLYKEQTLKEWIKINPDILHDYVLNQNKLDVPIYHLYTNAIDLESRLRHDTRTEFGEKSVVVFDEPRYVFAFRNEKEFGALLDCRIFVDGILVHNICQRRKGWLDYLYIPEHFVTNESYIEIEVYPSYEFKKSFCFTSMDQEEEITLLEPENGIFPTASDMYYVEPDGEMNQAYSFGSNTEKETSITDKNVTVVNAQDAGLKTDEYLWFTSFEKNLPSYRIYDDKFFKIISVYKEGEYEVKTINPEKPVKFTRLKTFKIKPASKKILNKNMEFHISKIPNGMEVMIENDGYPYMALVGAERFFKFNINYLRIYRNGRLIPREKYVFFSSYKCPRIQFLEEYKAGEIIYLDITPYRYTELYYQEQLEEHQPIVDLSSVIDKPFDIRYYDVFVNCRKMSLNSVFAISPWQISFVNLKSIYNIQVFEKERDWEYFGLDYKEHIYYYSLGDLFNTNFIQEEDKNKLIKDIIDTKKETDLIIHPNTNEEEKRDFTDLRVFVFVPAFYFNELIPKTYVNPDRLQFSNTLIWEEYTTIAEYYFEYPSYQDQCRTEYELAEREFYPNAVMLDPDIVIEGLKGKGTQHVFCVGHPTNVPDELLQQTIEIPDEATIIGGDN